MILDKIENWKQYTGLSAGIARGLELLASGKLDTLPKGRHELDGDALYASVQEYHPKDPAECRWEAHRKYIDIQYLVSGCEAMGCVAVDGLSVSDPYDTQKDVAFFFGGPEVGTVLKVETKMFAVFFPQDAHRPMMALTPHIGAGLSKVKKIVLKVAVE